MIDFKTWLENVSTDETKVSGYSQDGTSVVPQSEWKNLIIDAIFELPVDRRFQWSIPVKKIAEGSQANIYSTIDPRKVIRISRENKENACEKAINDPLLQATGGVNKVYDHIVYNKYIITLKEKLRTNWYDILRKKYSGNRQVWHLLDKIYTFYATKNLADFDEILIDMSKVPEMKNLVEAIKVGKTIPLFTMRDLHDENFALDKDDNIVIIDC